MGATEYRGYRMKASWGEGEPRVWQARWTAVRLSGSGAHSKSGSVRGTFTGEREADEAALGEARAWVDQNGRQERLRRGPRGKRMASPAAPFFLFWTGVPRAGPAAGPPPLPPPHPPPRRGRQTTAAAP